MEPYHAPQSGGTEQADAPALPKIDITPPAKFTKGAPEYTMQFQTTASNNFASRTARLRMISHPGSEGGASPKAYHMIPPSMKMSEYLRLLPPERGTVAHPGGRAPGHQILLGL
jgi:hypothetical protein